MRKAKKGLTRLTPHERLDNHLNYIEVERKRITALEARIGTAAAALDALETITTRRVKALDDRVATLEMKLNAIADAAVVKADLAELRADMAKVRDRVALQDTTYDKAIDRQAERLDQLADIMSGERLRRAEAELKALKNIVDNASKNALDESREIPF